MHVLFIGPRGSGKTSVGAWLAEHIARPFVDLDDRALATFAETTVTSVWAAHGEDAWRAAELAQLRLLLNEEKYIVLALGGGAPMFPDARELIEEAQLNKRAFVIYLRTSPHALRQRLSNSPGDRPSLTGADPIAEIERVLESRESTYEALADCICDTDECDVPAIGAIIMAEIRHFKA